MGLDDRLWYLLVGMAIGFVLGYLTRALNRLDEKVDRLQEELDEVDEIIKEDHDRRSRDEGGFITPGWASSVALFIVIAVTVGAAFLSQKASNDAQNAQDTLKRVTACNSALLSKTIVALNERTTYTGAQANTNVDLQLAQSKFFDLLLHRPPFSEQKRFLAAQRYQESQHQFLDLAKKTANKVQENPYPTKAELQRCLVVATK
jgi:hypothetical protein